MQHQPQFYFGTRYALVPVELFGSVLDFVEAYPCLIRMQRVSSIWRQTITIYFARVTSVNFLQRNIKHVHQVCQLFVNSQTITCTLKQYEQMQSKMCNFTLHLFPSFEYSKSITKAKHVIGHAWHASGIHVPIVPDTIASSVLAMKSNIVEFLKWAKYYSSKYLLCNSNACAKKECGTCQQAFGRKTGIFWICLQSTNHVKSC